MVDNELITKVRVRNVKSILSNVFTSTSGSGAWGSITGTLSNQTDLQSALNAKSGTLTNGNGTTANGTAVDLGGTISATQQFNWGGNYDIQWGNISSDNIEARFRRTSSTDASIRFFTKGNAGYIGAYTMSASGSGQGISYSEIWDGTNQYIAGYGPAGYYKIDLVGLGTNSTGDIYYRNSGGNLARLAAGTDGHVLTLASGLPSWAAPASGGWAKTGTTTLTGAVDIVGSSSNTLKHTFAGLGTTQTDGAGLHFRNTTAAAAGAQQISPSIILEGQGWKTNATAASQTVKFANYVLPVQGAASPTAELGWYSSINGGAYTRRMYLTDAGTLYLGSSSWDTNGSITLSTNRILLFNGGTGTIGGDTNSQLAFRTNASSTAIVFYRFFNTNGNYTATSGTQTIIGNENSFAPTSGTAVFNAYLSSGTINQTGGANGAVSMINVSPTYTAAVTVYGIRYNPTVTSVTNHYFINASSGRVLLGGLPTSSAGLSTGEIWNNSGVINIV